MPTRLDQPVLYSAYRYGQLVNLATNKPCEIDHSSQVLIVAGIADPKVMEQYGKWDAEGLAIGITKNTSLPVKAAQSMAESVNGTMSSVFGFSNGSRSISISGRGLDMASIYDAVRNGAASANPKIYIDGRLVSREMKNLGVQFA